MLRDIALIFFGLRVLLFAFFLSLTINKTTTQQALVVIPAVLYLILAVYVFLYPGRLKVFKNYGDLVFLPLLVFLSGQKEALLALIPPIALYSSRKVFDGMLFLWILVGFSFYHYGVWGAVLFPAFLALFIASLHPDLVDMLKKERFYIRKLRKSYHELSKEYAEMEKYMQTSNRIKRVMDELLRSTTLKEYLMNIKNSFGLKGVSIRPIQEGTYKEPVVDMVNLCFHVPVKLENGEVSVMFFFDNPIRLYDKDVLKTLEIAGKLINLYIEGLEDNPQTRAIAL